MKITEIYNPDTSTNLELPLFISKISAGFPSPAEDYLDKKLNLHDYLVSNETATFYVKVEGDSMINAGIMSGDILVVNRSLEACNNRIVVAVLNAEFTVKRFVRDVGRMYLMPENPKYPIIEINTDTDFSIWGIVTGVVRKLI